MQSGYIKQKRRENDNSVLIFESGDEEWEGIPSEDEHSDAADTQPDNDHMKKVANTVFNLFKNVCFHIREHGRD